MIRTISFQENGQHEVIIRCRICCQNPTLNPAQLTAAIARYAPELNPDFARFRRLDVFDQNEIQFR